MIIMDQIDPEACDPNFHPEFLVGCPDVLDPHNDVMLPSYGITDSESASRIKEVYRLWGRSDGVFGGNRVIENPGG